MTKPQPHQQFVISRPGRVKSEADYSKAEASMRHRQKLDRCVQARTERREIEQNVREAWE